MKRVEGLRGRKPEGANRPEDLAFGRVREPLPTAVVLEAVAEVLGVSPEDFGKRRRNSALRALASRLLIRYAGQRQMELAERLGTGTGGAISAQVARLPGLLAGDARLARKVRQTERRLAERRAQAAGEWSALAPGKTDR